jgi:anti-anti-sigma factor
MSTAERPPSADGGSSDRVLLTVTRHTETGGDESSGDQPAAAVLVVAPAGEVDPATAPLLRAALLDAVDGYPQVCCDLTGVNFLGAAGVTVLVAALERAAGAGSRLRIRGAQGITERVLRITGVDRMFPIAG